MTAEPTIADNDTLSPRDRNTINALKKALSLYAEYGCVLTIVGDGMKIENDIGNIIKPFIDGLKIRTYGFVINELNMYSLSAQIYVELVDNKNLTVLDFTVTPA